MLAFMDIKKITKYNIKYNENLKYQILLSAL